MPTTSDARTSAATGVRRFCSRSRATTILLRVGKLPSARVDDAAADPGYTESVRTVHTVSELIAISQDDDGIVRTEEGEKPTHIGIRDP